jgi:transposase
MPKTNRKYTKEFKQESVNLAIKSPSISHASRELGIPMATLHTWIKHLSKGEDTLKSHDSTQTHSIAKLLEENRRLNKELAIVREEKEILKKAATYFAQHQK